MRKGTLFILLGAMAFVAVVFVLLAHVQPIKVIDSRLEHAGDSVFVAGDLRNTGAHAAHARPRNSLLRPHGPSAW